MTLRIAGRSVDVPGRVVVGVGEAPWAMLDPADYRPRRRGAWVRQIIVHTTKGLWPQTVISGEGPGGQDERVSNYWRTSPDHSGAHLVVDYDGSIACLADLQTVEAYHATTSNAWSIGVEMCQRADGGIYEATLEAAVDLIRTVCAEMRIPLQVPERKYNNRPIERMREHGGPDMVGVFGHRDNAWAFPWQLNASQKARFPNGYSTRGRGDPGDEIFLKLRAAGAEGFNFDEREDVVRWRDRQRHMNRIAARVDWQMLPIDEDGIAGPATMARMAELGFSSGPEVDADAQTAADSTAGSSTGPTSPCGET